MKAKTIKWDGHQVTKPGLYRDLDLDFYHAYDICAGKLAKHDGSGTYGPSISSSGLRRIYGEDTSPRHFYAEWSGNPGRTVNPDKRHFVVGRALHHLVLGQPFFAKQFCAEPNEWPRPSTGVLAKWNNNRIECKEWHAARAAEGRTALRPREIESIKQMAISLSKHPLIGSLNGAIERSIFWKDKETGIWLKARPDAIPTDSADFTDVKTTRSVAPGALMDTLGKLGYYRQIALVRDACREVLGMEMESFTLIFVEKNPPYSTRDLRVKAADIDFGAKENRAAIRLFADCLKKNHWPGPGEGNEGNETFGMSPRALERKEAALKYHIGLDE